MSDVQFDEVMALALQLSPAEQARLVERLAAAMSDVLTERARSSEALTTEHEEQARQFEQAARTIGEEAARLGLTDDDAVNAVDAARRRRREQSHD